MKLPDLIYLDTAFIVGMYESVKGVSVPIKVVKKSNLSGGFSAGIFSTGASMEEEKEFPISSRKMYDELVEHLEKFPLVDLEKLKNEDIPELFWIEGVFGGSQSSIISGSDTKSSTDIFLYQNAIGKPTRTMPLLTNDAYFVSGYDQIAKHGWALTCGFGIQARMLNRLLCMDKRQPIAAPMVIIKTSNDVTPLERK
jgi:hypothetical protein